MECLQGSATFIEHFYHEYVGTPFQRKGTHLLH